jgi:PhzF family phenazine biosynthesis protein
VPIPLLQIDAFTSEAFRGNPAGVCLLTAPAAESWMQSVAAEMNLAETAFVVPIEDGFGLRWFTPTVEVDLCGHATLAAAHALWETGRLGRDALARFQTRSGRLSAALAGDWIELDFPATPAKPASPPPGMLDALGVTVPVHVGLSSFDYLVEADAEEVVRGLKPDFVSLRSLKARGVIVTSLATRTPADFVCRFFAPGSGIDEDPVTGSAYCCLAPYWSARLGKREFVAHQLSARGGVVRARLDGDRVTLLGQAITIFRAELLV